ncbi:MAG: aspartate carbamoyltransferase regulatory subunit [Candidatus Lokiarchaeota archaeon]|nr:aspartate carbamoyltransferase regulatory subunit [Candidatus Lokiarchaeota archaeon]
MSELTLRIEKIKQGTVIDHIEPGKAIRVLNILGLDGQDGRLITVAINVQSKKLGGKKDIIKVESVFLDNEQLNQISLISPKCSISYIKNFKVSKKFILNIPDKFIGLFPCTNENCISNAEREPVMSEFMVISEKPVKLRCAYCSRILRF